MSKIDPDPETQLTLDDKIIDQLKHDMGEDAAMVIESYVESIDEFLCDIENRTVRTPNDDLHRWAHTIKSSAASIGAMRLAHLAAALLLPSMVLAQGAAARQQQPTQVDGALLVYGVVGYFQVEPEEEAVVYVREGTDQQGRDEPRTVGDRQIECLLV
jgi:HPt (histidine-containing phosphotransfer) domain-containing protein